MFSFFNHNERIYEQQLATRLIIKCRVDLCIGHSVAGKLVKPYNAPFWLRYTNGDDASGKQFEGVIVSLDNTLLPEYK
jgi:hypothetical protein